MRQTLVFLVILVIAVTVYWPILRVARADLAKRSRAGLSNTPVLALLLIPLFGPILYLVFRGRFVVE